MKGWKFEKENNLIEEEISEPEFLVGAPKIKVTKSLITLADVLRFNGELESENIVLGENGIGIVSEIEANLFDLEKGNHVYVESDRECGECYSCIDGDYRKCSNIKIAGVDYDGFLRDFMSALPEKVFVLPDNVTDEEALYINQISRCIEIIDQLHVKNGDYVVVIGSNNFGNILSQLLIYYSAVPILICNDEDGYKRAKDSGIYYVLKPEDNWQKEVFAITSGRLAEKVVYINESGISVAKAFALSSNCADVAITGVSVKSGSLSLNLAVKKQLNIKCINNGFKNTASSINLLSNKAIKFNNLKTEKVAYKDIPETFKKLDQAFNKGQAIPEIIVEMV